MTVNLSGAPLDVVAEGRYATATTYYSWPGAGAGPVSTRAMVADQLYHFPMYVRRAITIDQIAFEVTTAVSSSNARVGIYTANTSWQPVTLLVDAGTGSLATAAVVTVSVTQALAPGRYLFVIVGNGAATLREFGFQMPGQSRIDTLGATTQISQLRRAFTYAALPAAANWDTTTQFDSHTATGSWLVVRVVTP